MSRAQGVDVSHHKPIKDYGALYDSGVRFVGVKATEGQSYVDPTLRTHRDELRRNPFVLIIYYHFGRSGDPVRQAERLQDAVGQLRSNERLCLDLEVLPATPDLTLQWVDRFYSTLMQDVCSDRRPLIYTSKRIWRTFGDPSWDLALDVDLWAPRYNLSAEPLVPTPWADRSWMIWQWSDGETPPFVTPGIGRCDRNYFNGDDQALERYARLTP